MHSLPSAQTGKNPSSKSVPIPSPMGFLGQILERPANERPFLLIPVGYPAPDAQFPVLTKKPLNEVMVLR